MGRLFLYYHLPQLLHFGVAGQTALFLPVFKRKHQLLINITQDINLAYSTIKPHLPGKLNKRFYRLQVRRGIISLITVYACNSLIDNTMAAILVTSIMTGEGRIANNIAQGF